VFFAASNKEDMLRRCEVVNKVGGKIVVPTTDIIDGCYAMAKDQEDSPFAIYHRTDKWDEVRDYSKVPQ